MARMTHTNYKNKVKQLTIPVDVHVVGIGGVVIFTYESDECILRKMADYLCNSTDKHESDTEDTK